MCLGLTWFDNQDNKRCTMADNKLKRVTIRVSEEEMKFLEAAAEKDDRTLSGFVRSCALTVAEHKYGEAARLAERERLLNKALELEAKEEKLEMLRRGAEFRGY